MKRTMILMAGLGLWACDDAANPGPEGQVARDQGRSDFGRTDAGPQGDAEADATPATDAETDADPAVADGGPDQGLPGECTAGETRTAGCPQVGVCAGQTRAVCGAEGRFGPCEPAPGVAGDERCDGLDNDCDGATDEHLPELGQPCDDDDADLCALGLWRCAADGSGAECVDDAAQVEACNGRDDDCDGAADEDLPDVPAADRQRGVCAGARRVCDGEGNFVEPDYAAQVPGYEDIEQTCDGLDNDCDGRIDVGLFAPRADRQAGICRNQRKTCAGAEGFVEPDYALLDGFEAEELTCDGVDNDCDGQLDEGVVPPPCPLTLGICSAPLRPPVCLGAAGFGPCDYGLEYERVERNTCDTLDNDCDGRLDEGERCPQSQRAVRVDLQGYTRGSPPGEPGRDADEAAHPVVFAPRALLVRATELTQQEWIDLTEGPNPAFFVGADRPVEQVSWLESVEVLNALSRFDGLAPCYVITGDTVDWPEGLDCEGWRLPTEAEWEFFARAGSRGATYADVLGAALEQIAWFRDNSQDRTQAVGRLTANLLALHDTLGNVAEWVWDGYGPYPAGEVVDPLGAVGAPTRVARGGAWQTLRERLRAANRSDFEPATRLRDLGLRPVRSLRRGL